MTPEDTDPASPQRFRIKAGPHRDKVGVWNGTFILSSGYWIIEIEDCPHGMQRVAVHPDELRLMR